MRSYDSPSKTGSRRTLMPRRGKMCARLQPPFFSQPCQPGPLIWEYPQLHPVADREARIQLQQQMKQDTLALYHHLIADFLRYDEDYGLQSLDSGQSLEVSWQELLTVLPYTPDLPALLLDSATMDMIVKAGTRLVTTRMTIAHDFHTFSVSLDDNQLINPLAKHWKGKGTTGTTAAASSSRASGPNWPTYRR